MSWVHERIFAAGGAHIPRTWASFADQTHVQSVLHLNPGHPQAFVGPPPRAFLWLGVVDEQAADDETRWVAAQFLRRRLEYGDALLIHSSLGRHRTRWIYVSYLICGGQSVGAALRRAEELPWQAPYPTDRGAWQRFARWLQDRRQAEAAGT